MSDAKALPSTRPSRWQVLIAVARGAAHEVAGRPVQDAAACLGDPSEPAGVLAVAVADGHGHARHARSAQGSELAAQVAVAAAVEHGSRFAAEAAAPDVCAVARALVIPDVIERWRRGLAVDLADHPLEEAETRWLRPDDDPLVVYGTTLLFAVVAHPWLVLCQIGDGDIVVVDPDGLAETPVPGDDRLDGRRTTSMCQHDARESFRCAAVDLSRRPVAAVLLTTDGFGNAQAADPWPQPVGANLVSFAREHGIAWVREQLPTWVARCASAEGSADDTTAALLLAEDSLPVSPVPVGATEASGP